MSLTQDLIKHYQMTPHPEGGYFVETYRSSLNFKNQRGERSASTAIHFLLEKGDRSHLHRLSSDEGWHYHLGDPLLLIEVSPQGKVIKTIIGPDFKSGQVLQYFVPAGHWFASESTGEFSFVGCTVSPGFDFADFEMANKSQIKELYSDSYKEFIDFVLEES